MFDRHYNTTAICMASRANVFTGMYECWTGTIFGHGDMKPDVWEKSYPVRLREAGYLTAFADKFGIKVEGKGLCEGDYDPEHGKSMSVAWFTSSRLNEPFKFCGNIGNGHPDPDICFANQIQKTPASVDLSELPAGYGFQFEIRMTGTTENESKPMLDAAADPPNFVIIFTDDQGYQDVGCFGSPDIHQYAFANTTLRWLGLPVKMHLPGSVSASSGMQRMVTFSSLSNSSTDGSSVQWQ